MTGRAQRDLWLRMSDSELLRSCRQDMYKASGPGGQHRNKVTTALRLRHEPAGVQVQAEEGRSLGENRRRAVHRLRERIAVEVRAPFDLARPSVPPEFSKYVSSGGRLSVNPKNADYPLVVATALDALAAAQGSYATAAAALGVTTSQITKFFEADREVWRWISEGRLRAPTM
ncbi:MAG TPA: peptide chain release factor-like protein [Dehalococcoidia bacterium]|nr:peptide chain release factor-like protein [Dehalococcoidia bacterium]